MSPTYDPVPAFILLVMAKEHELLYGHSDVARVWQNTVNCAIILEKTHRFSGDPEFGEIMARVRSNEHTEKDIDRLNERVIAQATEVESPSGEGVFHVSPNNNERFALQCAAFQKHLRCTHPTTDSNEDPPNHTIIVEAEFWHGKAKEKTPLSKSLTDFMKHRLTDNDIKVTSFCAQGAKLDAALRLFVGAMLMVFSNEDLKDKRANGTVCRVLEVLLKEGVQKRWKNWDGEIKCMNQINCSSIQFGTCLLTLADRKKGVDCQRERCRGHCLRALSQSTPKHP